MHRRTFLALPLAGAAVAAEKPLDLGGVTEKHVMVPMRDGTRLSTWLYTPKGRGPWPVIYEQRYAPIRSDNTRLESAEFVVRVRDGDAGVTAVRPSGWHGAYHVSVLPLGGYCTVAAEPSDEAAPQGDPVPGAEIQNINEVWFRFENGKLSWKSDGASGETVLNEAFPVLEVALRLPPGNEGEICFASPAFTTASGELASVLAVA